MSAVLQTTSKPPVETDAILREIADLVGSADHSRAVGQIFRLTQRASGSASVQLAAALALAELGRPDEAALVLEKGRSAFPREIAFTVEAARLAQRRGAHRDAYRLWSAVRRANPKDRLGWTGMAQAVREAGWPEVADDLLQLGPDGGATDATQLIEAAWAAHKRRDWAQAAGAWAAVRDASPGTLVGYIQGAVAFRELGRHEDAGELLDEACRLLPDEPGPFVERAWLAHHRRSFGPAVALWRVVRERFPRIAAGYVAGTIAALETGDLAGAEQLAAEAVHRFPDDAGAWIEHARVANRRRDWAEAVARWSAARVRFPDNPGVYSGMVLAYREQGRFTKADAVAVEAIRKFPNAAWPLFEHAWVAHVAHDWPESARRWQDLRARFPDHVTGWSAGAISLRELFRYDDADALLTEAMQRFPCEQAPVVEYAWLASARRDWVEAIRRWTAVRERFPALPEGYIRGAAAHAELWQYKEAETILRDGMARFPHDSQIVNEYAEMAMRDRRGADAEVRFRELRERFPKLAAGHLGAAAVLRDRFQLREAEELLEQAQRELPNEPRLALEHAIIPVFAPLRRDRDPDEASRRLAALRARFPEFEEGYLRSIRHLLGEDRFDDADGVAEEGMRHLPSSSAIAVEYGSIARRRGDREAAIARFDRARTQFPNHAGGLVGLGSALAEAGREAEAEAVLREAMERFPRTQAAFIAYAEIAMRREQWPEALARWTEAKQRFPDENAFAQRIFDVRLRMTADGEATTEQERAPDADPRAELRELVMQFESLGGRGIGCEFGMFQREFGAEPLGLLRWADMPFEGIVRVLETRFEGVGLEENTDVFVNRENSRPEYCTVDKRGFMFMRAFVYEDEMPIERMRRQALRRLVYLKDKLISDLEAGRKIFVWRCTERNLTAAEIVRLHRAVRSYGENWLLYVAYQDAAHPNGTVELAAPGLMLGYIDRFKMTPEGELSSAPPSASWTALCRNAYALWTTLTAKPEAAAAE